MPGLPIAEFTSPKVAGDVPLTTEIVRGVWNDIVLKVKLAKGRIGLWLGKTEVEKADGARITVGIPSNMVSFERQQLESQEHRQLIERSASEVLGRPVAIVFVTGRAAADNDAPTEAPEPPSRPEHVYSDPFVKKALELFDGRILNIEEK